MVAARRDIAAFWASFVESLDPHDPRRQAKPDAFGFGGEGPLADELSALVLRGRKRATASLPIEYTSVDEPLPCAGDLSVILDGAGHPVAIIQRTRVDRIAFEDVDEAFAADEGEGDGSLQFWREAHTGYFGTVFERLGGQLESRTDVLCQRFQLVWPLVVPAVGGPITS